MIPDDVRHVYPGLLGPYDWGNTLQEYYCLMMDVWMNYNATRHVGEFLDRR